MLQLEDSDADTCDDEELNSLFDEKCKLIHEHKITTNDTYILHVTGTAEANCNVAIGGSDNLCEVYNFSNNQLAKIDTLGEHSKGISGVRFSPESSNLLYSSSISGFINLWDLRVPERLVTQFKDTTFEESKKNKNKRLACFDVSTNNRLLAGGTYLVEGEAFILFWDVRNVKLLGGYWQSHTDDITQVRFHSDNVNLLTSGSVDGLINIYDLIESCEDDALINSLNTESSVEQLTWYKLKTKDCLSITTHTSDIQLWKTDCVEPYVHIRREDLGFSMKRKSSAHCYTVAVHSYDYGKVFLLAASNWNNGECLRALQIKDSKLVPLFMLKENTQRVRCSWYNEHHNILVTGGEAGILNFWNIDITT